MSLSRFLVILLVFAYVCDISKQGVEATHRFYENLVSMEAGVVEKVHRTGYHFQPYRHWMNDPNAPMYYKGVYHLFYQYNPKGSVWGNIVWAHSVSKDLINWEALEPAIYPSQPFDQYGCWSGSATILPGGMPVILYTGVITPRPSQIQVQNHALAANLSDPYLREWIKPASNPLVEVDSSINGSAFRDPTTAWEVDGHWRMLVGGRKGYKGMAYLYRSKDFLHWIKAKHPLHSAETGMWECPDFYPVSTTCEEGLDTSTVKGEIKHVMKNSLDLTRYDYYTIGTYDPEKDKYTPDEGSVDSWDGLRYDYGNFYASKTFFDPKDKRRILWGWSNESDTPDNDTSKGWAGIQAIPRKVWLDKGGKQLLQWPVEELDTLRENKVEISNKKLEHGESEEVKGITAAQADVEVTFSFESLDKAEQFDPSWKKPGELCALKGSQVEGGVGPFGLMTLASENKEEFTPVFFRVFKDQSNYKILMCSDAKSSSSKRKDLYKPSFAGYVDVDIAADKKIALRSLIDQSVVESFGAGGKTCITSRVYPSIAVGTEAHLFVFNNGTEAVTVDNLNAWSMNTPKMNDQE